MNRTTILLLLAAVACTFSFCVENAVAQKLTREGQRRKAAHSFLFDEFAKGRKCDFSKDKTILKEIVVSSELVNATGELAIELPEGSQRVASMFRHLVLRGENLDRVGRLSMHPYQANSTMHHSIQKPDIYRVQMGSLPVPQASSPRIVLKAKLSGPVVITEVAFSSQNKLRSEFDDIPFRNLGDEYPIGKVIVEVDTSHELSIEGHVDLEREKFFRYYAQPGTHHPSAENWALERGFRPGRQISKMQYALVKGYNPNQPKLKESKQQTGHADLSFFDQYNSAPATITAIEPFRDIDYAMCLDNWPDFMSIKHVGRGTPKVEYFDAAAELAASYIADQIRDGGRTATWWEVKNESTIKSEWDYHWDDNAWDLLAEFHNKVAQQVHQRTPDVKVGGPSSAWMQVQIRDFFLYKKQRDFMDATKGKLDFYSHHFYEDFNTIGAWERRKSTYSNYLMGRLEAILNMFRSHMHATDNVRPLLITECGSLQPGRGPSDYWLRLRSWNAFTHKFLQRPHEIDMSVPFAFLNVPWNPTSGDAAYIPDEGKGTQGPIENLNATPVTYFFELWRDFDGRRLPVKFDRQWLDATALHKGNKIRVALTNMGGQSLNVALNGVARSAQVKSINQKRLYYRDGEVQYEANVELRSLEKVEVDVEETTIVTIELHKPLEIEGTIERKFHYVGGTAMKVQDLPTDGFSNFGPAEIEMMRGERKSAKLIIGVHRDGGLAEPLKVELNGTRIDPKHTWTEEIRHLFAPIVLEVPDSVGFQKFNSLKLGGQEGLTITSIHFEIDR